MIEVVGVEAKVVDENAPMDPLIVSGDGHCVYLQQDRDTVAIEKSALEKVVKVMRAVGCDT